MAAESTGGPSARPGQYWAGRRVLVTGHTGFKGAWLATLLERLGADVAGVALPAEPGGACEAMAATWSVRSHEVDIRNPEALATVLVEEAPEVVFHLAAQAIVAGGYEDPAGTYDTNVMGTVNLLRALGGVDTVQAAVIVTSDKVYANDERGRPFVESDRLGGRDPYSSSKACAELVVSSWRESIPNRPAGLGSARAGNVIGGGDLGRGRLLPDVFRALALEEPILLRNPGATRPWQFVLDPLWGYLLYAEALAIRPAATPPALNFGPDPGDPWTVASVVDKVLTRWGGGSWVGDDRPYHTEHGTLVLDSSLAELELGWHPRLDLAGALDRTCEWTACARDGGDLAALAAAQIDDYLAALAPERTDDASGFQPSSPSL